MIKIERLPKMKKSYIGKYDMKVGEFYECIESQDGPIMDGFFM